MAKKKKTTKKKPAKKKTAAAKKKTAAKKKKAAKKKAAKKKAAARKSSPPRSTAIDAVSIAKKQRHIALLKKVNAGQALSKKEIAELELFEHPPAAVKGDEILHGKLFASQAAAARYADVTTKTIYNWKCAGMPMVGDQYAAMYLDDYKTNQGSESSELQNRNKSLEGDLKELKIQRLEIDIDVIRGGLVDIEEIEAGRIARILEAKSNLRNVGAKLAPRLKGKSMRQITKIINDELDNILRTFAGK